jgi:hypothetical protein
VPVPVARYHVSGVYLWAGLVALGLAAFSGWLALTSPLCWIATGLFVLSTILVLYLASRPMVEIHESHVKIGEILVPWRHVRRLDRSANIPLVVRLTLSDKSRIWLIFPGDAQTSSDLLRNLRRYAREALIDGVPFRQFWGETAVPAARKQLAGPRAPLLLPEDEAEVERMFQRLKSLGHLEEKTSSEDK